MRAQGHCVRYLFLYQAENRATQKQMSCLGPELQSDRHKDAVRRGSGQLYILEPGPGERPRGCGPKHKSPSSSDTSNSFPLNPVRGQRGLFSDGVLGAQASPFTFCGKCPRGQAGHLTPLLLSRWSMPHQASPAVSGFSGQLCIDSCAPSKLSCP